MSILIVSHLYEPSVNKVVKELDRRGHKWVRINCEEFPLFTEGQINYDGADLYGTLATTAGVIDTRSINTVWFRRWSKPALPRHLGSTDKDFIRNECSAFLNGFLDLIKGVWINPRASERAASKVYQLKTALACGLRVPKTRISNSSQAVQDFVSNAVDYRIAFKPVSGFSPVSSDFSKHMKDHFGDEFELEIEQHTEDREREIVFCKILDSEMLERIEAVKLCPVVFQEYIEKIADIRVTVVGKALYACRILSQSSDVTKHDFRKMVLLKEISEIPHEKIELPTDVQAKIFSLMNRLNLVFGCVDLLETKAGEYIFLEVNPSGQWLWIETLLGYPISTSLAELLIGDQRPD